MMSHLLEGADSPNLCVAAVGALFNAKDLLKSRVYRWDATHCYWRREIDADLPYDEKGWLDRSVYGVTDGHPTS
jgi:DNA polymerase-3 subunit epsilon